MRPQERAKEQGSCPQCGYAAAPDSALCGHRSAGDTMVLILAGGRGERLLPLTRDRTKAAVPFGGMYRLIDFTLSNCLHSGLHQIKVLAQYKFASLEEHLRLGWTRQYPRLSEGLALIPPQQRVNSEWYRGTADAVFQNIYTLRQENPRYTLILAADHVYRMDYRRLLEYHASRSAEMTLACLPVELAEAGRFGVLQVDADQRITGFEEKPAHPASLPARPGYALVSMGLYVFDTEVLIQVLEEDARRPDSTRDFGHDLIPRMVAQKRRVYGYNPSAEEGPATFYWRDIGDIDTYWEASMEMLGQAPAFDLYDPGRPVYTYARALPPARILLGDQPGNMVSDSLVCPGATVVDARVLRSILSPGVTVDHQAEVAEAILMEGVEVGPGARIHRAIVDKGVRIPAGYRLGMELAGEGDQFHFSPGGIVVVPSAAELPSRPDQIPVGYSYFGCGRDPSRDFLEEFQLLVDRQARPRQRVVQKQP